MKKSAYILIAVNDRKWRIGSVRADEVRFVDADPGGVAARQALEQLEWTGEAVVLALPSAWCYAAGISVEGLPKSDRRAMAYRFEEKLPLSAEELVADFLVTGEHALAVGSRINRVREAIDSLENSGIPVQSASPVSMLAAQNWSDEAGILVARNDGHCDVMLLAGGSPQAWAIVPANSNDLRVQMQLMLEGHEEIARLATVDVPEDLLPETALDVQPRRDTIESAAARTAETILAGAERAWVEFRRGALAIADPWRQERRAINAVLAAACSFLIIASAVMFYRGTRYQNLAHENDQQLSAAFHAQFPDWTTPANVRTVLESERRKRVSQGNGDLPAEARRGALQTLQSALGKVPADLHVSVDKMSFSDQTFELQGKARSIEDADELAKAARDGGLEVPPPVSRKETDGSWTFTIQGNVPAGAAEHSAAPKE